MLNKALTVILLSLTLLLFGCGDSEVNKNDTQTRNGKIYLPNSREPYTGTVYTIHSKIGEGFGDTASETQYVDGLKHGDHVSFYTNEQVKEKGDYEDGKHGGIWVSYHENGQLYFRETYKNGKRDGPYVRYYDDGQLYSKGTYKNGEEDGPWVHYYNDGRIWTKGTYKDGKFIPD